MPNRTGNEPADRPVERHSSFAPKIDHLDAFQLAPASSVGPGRLPGHPALLPVQGVRAPNAGVGNLMSASALNDESLLRFYDNVGKEVEADRDLRRRGHTHFFANGDGVKKYAAGLRAEMERRRLSFSPINWL
jgi:hypothetical protein